MGYALIWIESLAAALLFVALVTAVAARWRFGRRTVPVLVALLLFAFAVAVTGFMCFLHFRLDNHPISNPHSLSLIAWSLFLAAGSAVVLIQGLRRPGPEPAAWAWSRPKLALACGSLIAVTAIT